MAFRWRADDGPTLNAGLVAAIFHEIRTCIARIPVVMDATLAPAIFKPEKNLVFFQDKIAGAIDGYPGRLE